MFLNAITAFSKVCCFLGYFLQYFFTKRLDIVNYKKFVLRIATLCSCINHFSQAPALSQTGSENADKK